MNIGKMDRRIVIQSATTTVDTFGQRNETWADRRKTWAAKRDEFASERIEAGQVVEVSRTTWTIRHDPNLKHTERIEYEGEIYYILGVMELGRKEGQRVLTERRSSPR
jgi:SPP1 family predicted phage head-tail adaptor